MERQAEIEDAISAWTKERTVEDVEKVMMDAGVPDGRVNSVKEIMEIGHLKVGGAVEDVWIGEGAGWNVKMPRVLLGLKDGRVIRGRRVLIWGNIRRRCWLSNWLKMKKWIRN